MNEETILDIYRRAWGLLSLPMKQKIIAGLDMQDEGTQSGLALIADFRDWCIASDAAERELRSQWCPSCGEQNETEVIAGGEMECLECGAVWLPWKAPKGAQHV